MAPGDEGRSVVRLTCLLRRKDGLTPEEFHAHWRDVHGPLIASSRCGRHVLRYEQHPRPLDDYGDSDDGGYDGVTVQWFADMNSYLAHMSEPDFAVVWQDIERFLDTTRLHFVVTAEPRLVMGEPGPPPMA